MLVNVEQAIGTHHEVQDREIWQRRDAFQRECQTNRIELQIDTRQPHTI